MHPPIESFSGTLIVRRRGSSRLNCTFKFLALQKGWTGFHFYHSIWESRQHGAWQSKAFLANVGGKDGIQFAMELTVSPQIYMLES